MSEVDFENSLREEFVERGLTDALEPAVEATPKEEVTEESTAATEQRERDEHGRFVAKENAADDVPEHERFIKERFAGDPAKLAQSYQELERKLGEQGNQLGTEVQRLRQEVDELRTPQEPQQAPITEATVQWFDEQVNENPQGAAVWALQNKQGILYERALDQWYTEDAKAASRFERQLEMAQVRAELRDEIAPTLAPVAAQASNARFNDAWTNVAENYPDLNEFGDAIFAVAEANPRLLKGLQSQDVGDVETVIENLYLRVQRDQAGAVRQAAADAATQNAESARAAKVGATVTSASSSSNLGGEGKSAQDRFLDGIVEASKQL